MNKDSKKKEKNRREKKEKSIQLSDLMQRSELMQKKSAECSKRNSMPRDRIAAELK